jgi:hypothetical protein
MKQRIDPCLNTRVGDSGTTAQSTGQGAIERLVDMTDSGTSTLTASWRIIPAERPEAADQ